jgi:hypothetical protein
LCDPHSDAAISHLVIYAGDDPVNEGDPSGRSTNPASQAEKLFHQVRGDITDYMNAPFNTSTGVLEASPTKTESDAGRVAKIMLSIMSTPHQLVGLSAGQLANAYIVDAAALDNGLSEERSLEMVAFAFRESSLRATLAAPLSTSCEPGSGGLFQICTINPAFPIAQELGGVFNPVANTEAILTPYERYWSEHPHCSPGAAAPVVEISGYSATYYAEPIPWFVRYFPWQKSA